MRKSRTYSDEVREPVYADRFYPSAKGHLLSQLEDLFGHARDPVDQLSPRAIIAPHAGIVYSGVVAASAYNQLKNTEQIKRVFVIASSHQFTFSGASPDTVAWYNTPLGKIKIDTDVSNKLIKSGRIFRKHFESHRDEHGIEVQLPFLQYKLGSDFLLVPLLLGTHKEKECEQVALYLEPWFTPENLFVISTDFSHYPAYDDAVANDLITAEAICTNNPHKLMETLGQGQNISNLATSLCGWPAVTTLLYLTQNRNMDYRMIQYLNSGDAEPYGDKEKVVGYWAIAAYENQQGMNISRVMQENLLRKARDSVVRYVKTGDTEQFTLPDEPGGTSPGMFVSVYVKGELRGCVGSFGKGHSMNSEVEHLAVSASCDARFSDISPYELDDLTLEISILSPPRKIRSADEIIPGKHGIYLKKGLKTGTFLPKVATYFGWNALELLRHCAHDKAGIGWDGWKTADIYVYEAFVFSG